jgi:hypothetical protein
MAFLDTPSNELFENKIPGADIGTRDPRTVPRAVDFNAIKTAALELRAQVNIHSDEIGVLQAAVAGGALQGPPGPPGADGAPGAEGPPGPPGADAPVTDVAARWAFFGVKLQATQPTELVTYEQWVASGGVGYFGWIQTPQTDTVYILASPMTLGMALNPSIVSLDAISVQATPIGLGLAFPTPTVSLTDAGVVDVFASVLQFGAPGAGAAFGLAIPGTTVVVDPRYINAGSLGFGVALPTPAVSLEGGGGGTSVTETFDAALTTPPWALVSGWALPNVSGGAAVLNTNPSGAKRSETFSATQYAWIETTPPGEDQVVQVGLRTRAVTGTGFFAQRFYAFDGDASYYHGVALYRDGAWVAEYAPYTFVGIDVETTAANTHRVRVYGKNTLGAAWTLLDTRSIVSAAHNPADPPSIAIFGGGTIPHFAAGDGLLV